MRSLRALTLLVTLGTLGGIGGGAASGAPATYTQYACQLPDGRPAPTRGFSVTQGGLGQAEDRCAFGDGFVFKLPATSSWTEAWGEVKYGVPPGTTVGQIDYIRAAPDFSSPDNRSSFEYRGPDGSDRCGYFSYCSNDPTAVTGTTFKNDVSFVARCLAGEPACRGAGPGDGRATVNRIAITLRDESLPTFTRQPAGDLFADGPVSGTRQISFAARDTGGGVYQAALLIDGVEQPRQSVDANGGACAEPFTAPVPCKLDVEGTLTLDTTTLDDGAHNVSVLVYDATGTNQVTFGPVPIKVLNHPTSATAGQQTDAPAVAGSSVGGVRLVMASGLAKPTIRRRVGRPTQVQGRLVDGHGAAVAGAVLSVFTKLHAGAERQVGTVTTKADGAFALPVTVGRSGEISIRYGSDPKLEPLWQAKIEVPAPLRLLPSKKRLRNKQKLMLTAYLFDTKAPAGSADVAFQVRIGNQWRTFATRPINREGRARIGHRFTVTFQRLTYRFRAIVVGRRTFPFSNATSPAVAVQVN